MNTTQYSIDFTVAPLHHENNLESQKIYEANKDRFSNQCRIVYEAMLRGERLTTTSALLQYGIGDLRRRVKDLKDEYGVPVQSELTDNRFKEYFLILNN
ncbi:helix-turn-helix domain-containing protein [Flavobacterium sedimenticola]|uniref:Helix-turn-helix domain-containing protein n=1 Tax=Flavobacterium sedimenticola TaxID=3043286 RepID=A0ABT6XMQ1_9FLAO|nr:helix-turn-helix domain-containing protein [Flavobacterium sedimenticola]MDI9256355.1 helix-turn-helix domain-containing protein [Flavobacterium sedimenticola]